MSSSIEVTVESLGGLGDGLASHHGKTVFIPKSCPGDVVDIRIVHENHDGMHGQITRIITPSPQRQQAPCRYFDQCGGCTLQQLAPEHYRTFKTRILHNALHHAGFPSPQAEVVFLPAATRRRVEFKVNHADGAHTLSFHALRSHQPVAVDACSVLTPALQAMIAPINAALSAYPAADKIYAVSLTAADSGMDMILTFKGVDIRALPPLDTMAEALSLSSLCVRTPEQPPITVVQRAPVEMLLGGYAVPLSAGAFLQATAEGQQQLTAFAMEAAEGSATVADLFCGIGTYSFPLCHHAHVHAMEGDEAMVSAMRSAAKRHAIKTLSASQRDLFRQPLGTQELARFDTVIINPPRLGAKAQCEQLAGSDVKTIAMISCNPATFARDAKILKAGGYTLSSVQGIDQFVWNQHLEIAALFRR